MRGQPFFGFQNLRARFAADHRLEIAHHRGIRMRSQNRAQQIVRSAHIGDPIAHGFVDGVLQRAAAGFHANHFRAKHTHARDIQRLPRHVLRAHVHGALQAEMGGHGGRSHAMLPRACFRNDARLAHLHGEEPLPDGVVDLVRAGVQQVFALQVNARAAKFRGEARSELQRRGPPGKVFQQILEPRSKRRIGFGEFVDTLKLK